MTKAEIREFKGFVVDELMKQYNMKKEDARRSVRDSYLSGALRRDQNYVDHDTVEEWAEFIDGETKRSALLTM